MSKEKVAKEPKVLSESEKIMEMVKKDYGENILISARDILDREQIIIPVSPASNVGLNGGIPGGSWVTLAGKPKCGKTTKALHIAKKAQDKGYTVVILNVESRIKKMNLESVQGLDIDKVHIVESTKEKVLSAQDFLSIGEKFLLGLEKCCLVIDSYSSLCHEKELTDGIGTSTRGGQASLLAQFTRQMASPVTIRQHIVIGITHLMANTSGYGAATMEKGGNAIAYQVDVKLRCTEVKPWPPEGKRIGQTVLWKVECTALGAPPGYEILNYIRYGQGIDEIVEGIELGAQLGLITKAGAWLTCEFMKPHLNLLGVNEWNDETKKLVKTQGQEKMYQLLKENPKWLEILDAEIQKITK